MLSWDCLYYITIIDYLKKILNVCIVIHDFFKEIFIIDIMNLGFLKILSILHYNNNSQRIKKI